MNDKDKQIEGQTIEGIAKLMVDSDNKEVADTLSLSFVELAEALYNAGYRKQSEGEWLPYSIMVGERQITGWLCGNCKKYSTGLRNYCPECGTKMKGGAE